MVEISYQQIAACRKFMVDMRGGWRREGRKGDKKNINLLLHDLLLFYKRNLVIKVDFNR